MSKAVLLLLVPHLPNNKVKNYFRKISAFLLTLVVIFVVIGYVLPQTTLAQGTPPNCEPGYTPRTVSAPDTPPIEICAKEGSESGSIWETFLDFAFAIPGHIAIRVLQISSLLTYLAGALLNLSVQYSVVEMKTNLAKAGSIDLAWTTIRDIANMGFIFILLYAAIRTILGIGSDTKKLIVNVIVVAILINFSLFFTKLVIDISNVLAVTFYDAIAPGALTNEAQGMFGDTGIADSLMQPLRLPSLWKTDISGLDGSKLLTIGVMGTIVTLIAAFVFFAVAIMFIIRFVVLVFVLILSPIAFMAFVLPQLKKYGDQWTDALIGQAFFAPIYFLLTWIVIMVSRGLLTGGGDMATALTGTIGANGQAQAPTTDSLGILVNFIIMIVLLIASLIIAKDWASKTPGGVGKLTSWAMGAAGGATMGMAGRFGRNVIGSRAAEMANDEQLKKRAAEGSLRARLQLATARKASTSSFDVRGTGLGGSLDAGKAQKGGFVQDQKDRAKSFERYKPSDSAQKAATSQAVKAKGELEEARRQAEESARTSVSKLPELTRAESELEEARREASTQSKLVGISDEARVADDMRKKARVEAAERKVIEEKRKHDETVNTYIKTRTSAEESVYGQAQAIETEMKTRMENMAKKMESSKLAPIMPQGGLLVSGKSKASAIRAAAKGKSTKEQLAETAAKLAKEEGTEEEPEDKKVEGEGKAS